MAAAPGTSALRMLRQARDRIDRDYAEPVGIASLAAAAGYSHAHFIRAFHAAYGETPGAYRTRRRVERACELLRSVNLSVTEICHTVGFTSLGSFSARFSGLMGQCFALMWRTGLPAPPEPAAPGEADGPEPIPSHERRPPPPRSAISEKRSGPAQP